MNPEILILLPKKRKNLIDKILRMYKGHLFSANADCLLELQISSYINAL